MNQIYVIPQECVDHLIEDGIFTDREKAKRIGTKCGEILSPLDYEVGVNNGDIDLTESVILID